MKSLNRRFKNIQKKKPYWSSLTQFSEAIKGQNFSKKVLYYWFNKLVEKDDYCKTDKKSILDQLVSLSYPLEEGMNRH